MIAQEKLTNHPEGDPFIPRTSAHPAFYADTPREYNLKWGNLTARLQGSVQAEYNDNINLSERNPRSDFVFGPYLGLGFLWPVSERNLLQFDIGLGYRAYLNNPSLNSIQISPDSRLSYQIRVLKALLTIHDQFSVEVDPLSRGELSGVDNSLLNYRRFNNNLGFELSWEAMREITLLGGYDYVLDRSLTSDFLELDRDDHVLRLAAYRPLSSRFTAGLSSSYTLSQYQLPIHNNGETLTIGPNLIARVSDFLTADLSVGYTTATYDQTGTIQDSSDFEGMSFSGGLKHRMNSRTTQTLRVVKNIDPGFQSNFTDVLSLQYGLEMKMAAALTLHGTFVFEDLSSSGRFGEESKRYLAYLGTKARVSRRWLAGLSYSFGWKDSQLPGRDYTQNRITLDVSHEF